MVVGFAYGIFYEDAALASMFVAHYAIGGLIISALIRRNVRSLMMWYSAFFVLYGVYLFFIQMNLVGYYGNPDEAGFFQHSTNAISYGWDQMLKVTFLKSYYGRYPAAMLLFSIISKIGHLFGVEQLRLYGRFHLLVMGSGIMGIVGSYMDELGYDRRRALRYALAFGLGTYVLLETCNYTRDIHILFLQTVVGYKVMTSSPRNVITVVEVVLISIVTYFFRDQNGLISFVFVGVWAYMYGYVSKRAVIAGGILGSILMMGTLALSKENASVWVDGHSGTGLFSMINSLPVFLHPIVFTLFMLFQPFPIDSMIQDVHSGSWLALPMMFQPVIVMYVFWVLYESYKSEKNKDFILFLMFAGYFVLVSFMQPIYRRVFLLMPCTFLLFLKRQDWVDRTVRLRGFKRISLSWGFINLVYVLYDLIRHS